MNELKRHIYSNTVDRSAVKKLLREVFLPCRCREAHQKQQRQVTQECNLLSRVDNNITNLLRSVVACESAVNHRTNKLVLVFGNLTTRFSLSNYNTT